MMMRSAGEEWEALMMDEMDDDEECWRGVGSTDDG